MAAGSRIAAVAALVGVALALAFLPGRLPEPAVEVDEDLAGEPVLVDAA